MVTEAHKLEILRIKGLIAAERPQHASKTKVQFSRDFLKAHKDVKLSLIRFKQYVEEYDRNPVAPAPDVPAPPPPPTTPTESEQIIHLRKANGALLSAIATLKENNGSLKEMSDLIAESVKQAEPFAPYSYPPAEMKSSPVVPVFKWSDWHIGEVIRAEETEGFGEFDYAIAEERLFGMVEDFLQWIEVQRRAYNITTCTIFGEGDYVSGDIHPELLATNEFPLPVQTAKAGLLMGEAIRRIAQHFDVVTMIQVNADNHGRLQKKPQAKQKGDNNMGYLVHTIANQYAAKIANFTPIMSEGAKFLATVNGYKFLIEHGDSFRGWMGIPYYGMMRSRHREANKRMTTDKGFHYHSMGHWHVPALVEGQTIVNGALSGTSEFDHIAGRHADPAQVAFLVNQKHGIFNIVPFAGR
jgi:hypothetical protein